MAIPLRPDTGGGGVHSVTGGTPISSGGLEARGGPRAGEGATARPIRAANPEGLSPAALCARVISQLSDGDIPERGSGRSSSSDSEDQVGFRRGPNGTPI